MFFFGVGLGTTRADGSIRTGNHATLGGGGFVGLKKDVDCSTDGWLNQIFPRIPDFHNERRDGQRYRPSWHVQVVIISS